MSAQCSRARKIKLTHPEFGIFVLLFSRGGCLVQASLFERLLGAVVQRRISAAASGDNVGRVNLSKILVVLVQSLVELKHTFGQPLAMATSQSFSTYIVFVIFLFVLIVIFVIVFFFVFCVT